MSVATGSLAGLEDIWGARRPRARGAFVGTAVAVGLHVFIAAILVRVDTSSLLRGEQTVEMEVAEPPPPPPPEVKAEPEAAPPPEPKPRIVVRHAPTPVQPASNPPPSAAPEKPADTPPVFGVSLDSTVSGPGLAVPVGNTLMAKPHKDGVGQPLAGSGDPDRLPAPVPEVFIAEQVKVLEEVRAAFPRDVERLGIEGKVVAKLYIDETGRVRRVTILENAGHGFDEAAREALKKFKFSPARTSDGKAVPTNITYTYRFEQAQ